MIKEDIERVGSCVKSEQKELTYLKKALSEMIHLQSDKEQFRQLGESLNVYQILAYYLISLFPLCSMEFIEEYFVLIFFLTVSLNEEGYLFLKDETGEKKKDICLENQISILPEIFNIFIAELFPVLFKKLREKSLRKFVILGYEEDNIKNLVLMVKFLGNWLYDCRFLKFKIEVSFDF